MVSNICRILSIFFLSSFLMMGNLVFAAEAATVDTTQTTQSAEPPPVQANQQQLQFNPAQMNAASMLTNFAKTMPNLMRLITALAYVMGLYFAIKGVMALKVYGEQRTQMSGHHSLKKPLSFLFVGVALIYLPTSVQVGMSTFYANPFPYSYINENSDPWSDVVRNAFMIFELIGAIAFIRGLILLSHGGDHQQGTTSKAFAFIISGLFCINMYTFIQVVWNTFGLGQV